MFVTSVSRRRPGCARARRPACAGARDACTRFFMARPIGRIFVLPPLLRIFAPLSLRVAVSGLRRCGLWIRRLFIHRVLWRLLGFVRGRHASLASYVAVVTAQTLFFKLAGPSAPVRALSGLARQFGQQAPGFRDVYVDVLHTIYLSQIRHRPPTLSVIRGHDGGDEPQSLERAREERRQIQRPRRRQVAVVH